MDTLGIEASPEEIDYMIKEVIIIFIDYHFIKLLTFFNFIRLMQMEVEKLILKSL